MPRRYTDIDSSNLIAYLAHRDRRFDDRGSIATYRELGPGSEHSWSRKHPPHGWKYLYSTTASVDAWIDRMATILDSKEEKSTDDGNGSEDNESSEQETRLRHETALKLLSGAFPGVSREYIARAIDANDGNLELVFKALSGLFSVSTTEGAEEWDGKEEDSTEDEEDVSHRIGEPPSRKRKRRMPAESDEEGEDNGEAFPGGHIPQAKRRGVFIFSSICRPV
ncbi:hypothetical protein HMN09_01209500 [Mycena chlorophos]|uniref:CUE domain-containing protein n=1 Tax=Mycena chlorophos TaxID=658473 RepID=A0A8H6S6P2_MYCCL|nr:hypothetical protein HMN09_01209500 [Mycena chlorophos]